MNYFTRNPYRVIPSYFGAVQGVPVEACQMFANRKRLRSQCADFDQEFCLNSLITDRCISSDDESTFEFCGPFAARTLKSKDFGSATKRKNIGFSFQALATSPIPESD